MASSGFREAAMSPCSLILKEPAIFSLVGRYLPSVPWMIAHHLWPPKCLSSAARACHAQDTISVSQSQGHVK